MWEHLQEEFVKDDMHGDRIGIEGVNSGGIHQIKRKPVYSSIPPAADVIGKKPPNIANQMGATNRRDFVPKDTIRRRTAVGDNTGQIFHAL